MRKRSRWKSRSESFFFHCY